MIPVKKAEKNAKANTWFPGKGYVPNAVSSILRTQVLMTTAFDAQSQFVY